MTSARAVALDALDRIEHGAYANLVLPGLLQRSELSERDRGFVTELVYGTTRMRRACDWLVDRFLFRPVEPSVRNVLRLGAYQLVFLQTPPHAAVDATVRLVPGRARGLVNAVLRKVAGAGAPEWPDEATRLSYPTWIVDRLTQDLGRDRAMAALEQMNRPAPVTERPDGYIQDTASQQVAKLVGVRAGDRVADLCAGPGGKSTLLASEGAAIVAAGDVSTSRARLVSQNVSALGAKGVGVFVGDGRRPPLAARAFDRVLVDAPCSGLGVLRRRADARWRVQASDVGDLAVLQRALLEAASSLVRADGHVVYSVCTLTEAESLHVDDWCREALRDLEALEPPGAPWEPVGRGARLLPQTVGSDGMYVLRLRKSRR